MSSQSVQEEAGEGAGVEGSGLHARDEAVDGPLATDPNCKVPVGKGGGGRSA